MSHVHEEELPATDEARLSPLLDEELSEAEARPLRARVERDPDLARARSRLERLTALSQMVLRAAPPVSAEEWRARGERVLSDAAEERGRREARVLSLRASVIRFAVAAAFLLVATLALPFISPPERREGESERLFYTREPGANEFEVLEAWNNRTDYYIWLDFPSEPSDAVVIWVSKV
jgi:hypothetical protein